jgi:hypothetical protein
MFGMYQYRGESWGGGGVPQNRKPEIESVEMINNDF